MKQLRLNFYFVESDGKFKVTSDFVPEHLAKPSYLKKLAISKGAIFVSCEKYGCRQFQGV